MQATIVHRVQNYIETHDLLHRGSSVLVGLSGGPDSVFLLHVLTQMQPAYDLSIYAAHLDHEWRDTSHHDMEFCQRLAASYNIPFFHEKASNIDISTPMRGSWEAHGRLIRRSLFASLQEEHDIDYIALGHHKDDQRETFFIRLLRGAGLTGLSGIQPQHRSYIHPLLDIEKHDICAYLDEHGISYLTDPSNISDTMLRNRIRTYLMPALSQCDERAVTSLDRAMQNLQEADAYLQHHVQQRYADFTRHDNGITWLHIASVQKAHAYLRRQILLKWLIDHGAQFTPSAGFFKELERFFNNRTSTTHTIHPEWGMYKDGGYVRIYRTHE